LLVGALPVPVLVLPEPPRPLELPVEVDDALQPDPSKIERSETVPSGVLGMLQVKLTKPGASSLADDFDRIFMDIQPTAGALCVKIAPRAHHFQLACCGLSLACIFANVSRPSRGRNGTRWRRPRAGESRSRRDSALSDRLSIPRLFAIAGDYEPAGATRVSVPSRPQNQGNNRSGACFPLEHWGLGRERHK